MSVNEAKCRLTPPVQPQVENSCEMSCRFCTFVCANSGPRPGQLAAVNDRDEGLSQALEERIEKYLASGQHKSRGGLV